MSEINPEENDTNPYLKPSGYSSKGLQNWLSNENNKITAIGVVVIVVILGFVFANTNSSDSSTSNTVSVSEDWPPRGFNEYSDDYAIRWTKDSNVTCEGCIFWSLQVVPRSSCQDGIEGSLKVTYSPGNALYGNTYAEETYFVPGGETVNLTFKAYPKDLTKNYNGEVVYVGCR